ncbi:MAG: type II toxin-antitoxin system HipA family toxin [Bacteroidales bacterium]|nr:type II toxin-antitoxin system HipA family toxin [Candidatus Cryptobacteroides aphodequi]
MTKNPVTVDVMLWGTRIGRLTWDAEKHLSVFQFSEEYASLPYDVCPSTHRKGRVMPTAFYGKAGDLYQGLPEFIADALPDKWGSSLFDKWLTENKVSLLDSTPLLKLSYIGKRAMGALEFVPEYGEADDWSSLDMSSLANLASEIYQDRFKAAISEKESITMKKLIYLGTSAGGKRPKAVVAYNPMSGIFRSGQVDLPEGFKHYIIKFKEDPNSPTSEIEMIWHEMAKEAGITMMPCFLKEIDGRNHFITERFDRIGGEKVFTQTLASIMPGADDYMKIGWLANTLDLPQEDRDQLFIRMVFNFAAGVSDDHNKNFSFTMDKSGKWRLSPAYDVMFTANIWEDRSAYIHSLGVMGKKSSLSIADFIEFAEDFVDSPEEKIEKVLAAVDRFGQWCDNYNIESEVREKIQSALDFVRPK